MLTKKQLDSMRHACGLTPPSKTPYYRNHFAADPGSDDDQTWAGLVAVGLAEVLREPEPSWMPLRVYGVTFAGKAALSAAGR